MKTIISVRWLNWKCDYSFFIRSQTIRSFSAVVWCNSMAIIISIVFLRDARIRQTTQRTPHDENWFPFNWKKKEPSLAGSKRQKKLVIIFPFLSSPSCIFYDLNCLFIIFTNDLIRSLFLWCNSYGEAGGSGVAFFITPLTYNLLRRLKGIYLSKSWP